MGTERAALWIKGMYLGVYLFIYRSYTCTSGCLDVMNIFWRRLYVRKRSLSIEWNRVLIPYRE